MHRFSWADADQYSQDFHATGPGRHGGVKAAAALFDSRHMEPGSVRYGLTVSVRGQVVISSWNRGKLTSCQAGYCLPGRQSWDQDRGYSRCCDIESTNSYPKLAALDLSVGFATRPCSHAARQSATLIQIHRRRTL